jgi:hypothetical protein
LLLAGLRLPFLQHDMLWSEGDETVAAESPGVFFAAPAKAPFCGGGDSRNQRCSTEVSSGGQNHV